MIQKFDSNDKDIYYKNKYEKLKKELFKKRDDYELQKEIRFLDPEHILIDGTFSYPKQYQQTIVIMYLDVIILKMIPGIFIITNNKTYEGYICIFTDLLTKNNSIIKTNNSKLKMLSFISDFEVALYTSFFNVFKTLCPNVKYIGCLYHYLSNIEKHLKKYGFGSNLKKNEHDLIIKLLGEILFKNDIDKNIKDELLKIVKIYYDYLKELEKNKKENFSKKIEKNSNKAQDFFNYVRDQWLPIFEKGILNLKDINIKIRTNNWFDNFNKLFNPNFSHKHPQEPYIFL